MSSPSGAGGRDGILVRIVRAAGPESGGAVMATGIVSVAMWFAGRETLSRVLLVLGAAAWVALGLIFVARLGADRRGWRAEAARPAALTAVAGTAVLGTRLTQLGWAWAGSTALVLAAALWLVLAGYLLRRRPQARSGAAFLLVVGPQSLAVLAAVLAVHTHEVWPALVALGPFAIGTVTYPAVLAGFDLAELRSGAGDHWVSGGALAISTLACAEIAQAVAGGTEVIGAIHDVLRVASLVLWVSTVLWLPGLVAGEVRRPRPRYDVRRWATVFPLGMYSVMSVATGRVAGVGPLVSFGHVWAWVALAAWGATAAGALHQCLRL